MHISEIQLGQTTSTLNQIVALILGKMQNVFFPQNLITNSFLVSDNSLFSADNLCKTV